MDKHYLGIDVLTAARQRIAKVFADFPRVYASFSGGKDSSAMLHLIAEEARRSNRKFGCLFIDWEAQFKLTISHVEELIDKYADVIEPHWVTAQLKTTNACSMHEPEWICWDEDKRDFWVRQKPSRPAICESDLPFYKRGMTFEEFCPAFGNWYSQGKLCAAFIGIRTQESLNRWRSITRKKTTYEGNQWTTWMTKTLYNAYPIYDWTTEDIWRANAKFGWEYNRLYDRMYQAGLSIHQMRICEPYGDEQRKGLWLYHLIEPETWSKVVNRVAGTTSASLYAAESGNILGNRKIFLPQGHTWSSYARFILDSMPSKTAEHYRCKIHRYIAYCINHYGMADGIPEEQPGDTGGKDIPSWRRVCRCLLKNDYWCKSLSFSPTQTETYQRYLKNMKSKRSTWDLIG